MARAVNVYVKRQLRLDLLTVPQRKMYDLGVAALASIRERVARAQGVNDSPAPPLKMRRRRRWSKSQQKWVEYGSAEYGWPRIKKKFGLKPIRDLHGTGLMWPENYKGGKRKPRLKFVGHLMEQLSVRKVSDNKAHIVEPSTRAGRKKARAAANRAMLGFSPFNRRAIVARARAILIDLKNNLIKTIT